MIIENLQEFCQFFHLNQPIMAVDYGSKKIGIAISNPERTIAMPLQMIHEEKKQLQAKKIALLTLNYKACAIVIGLPVNMNGEIGPQAEIIFEFVKILEKHSNLPIYLQDERLTTKAANNMLKAFGQKRKIRNNNDDVIAASLILETTLDSIKRLI